MGHEDDDRKATLMNDLSMDVQVTYSFTQGGVASLRQSEPLIPALGQIEIGFRALHPGTDSLVVKSSQGHSCEIVVVVEVCVCVCALCFSFIVALVFFFKLMCSIETKNIIGYTASDIVRMR